MVGRAELWKQAATAKAATEMGPPGEDDEPPPLNDAAARQAAAAMSAAMSSKLATAAAAGTSSESAIPAMPTSGASGRALGSSEALPRGEELIKAAPAAEADSPSCRQDAQQQQQPRSPSRISSMVQHYESLSPGKHAPDPCADALPEDSMPRPGSSSGEGEGDARAGSAMGGPRPKRTASQRALLRAAGRRAHFADVPEDSEQEDVASPASAAAGPASASTATSPAAKSTCSNRSPTPFPGRKSPLSSAPGCSLVAGLPGGGSQQKAPPSKRESDQSLAAELQDAESCSQFSGISGASSGKLAGLVQKGSSRGTAWHARASILGGGDMQCPHSKSPPVLCAVSSHFSRLAGHARRRSRRKDYPPLRGTSLFYFKASSFQHEGSMRLFLLPVKHPATFLVSSFAEPCLPFSSLTLPLQPVLPCRWTTLCEASCTTW